MARRKLLNGLPNNLIASFFSTLRYWEKGYMSDWIVNSSIDLKVKDVHIDILSKQITPKELDIKPISHNIAELESIIKKVTKHAGFESDFIKQAVFDIKIYDNRLLKCKTTLIGENGEIFDSKDYIEKSYEEFKVFNRSVIEKGIAILKVKYYRLRNFILGRRAIENLRYTKRVENMMK
jgi:hypothetical protein